MDKIAIIGTGDMSRIIAERAKELNIESHCFSNDENMLANKELDNFHNIDIFDIDRIAGVCRKNEIKGVIATTELTILPAAQVAQAIGAVGNDVNVAAEITDKYKNREKVRAVKELNQPEYWFVQNGDTIPEINTFPVIVKPMDTGGKRGINVVKNAADLSAAVMEALDISRHSGVIMEEYLDGGQEYSVESLSYHGKTYVIQVTQKDSSGAPHCVELGHHQPADLTAEMRRKVEKAVSEAINAVGYTNGPSHTEIKIINDKIYLIEINARPGGDHISYPLTEISSGYPYITGIIMASLDKLDVNDIKPYTANYCGVYFVTEQTSFLKPVFDKCESYDWFYKKNKVTDELTEIIHNDGFNTNYFMYCSKKGRPVI